MSTSCRQAPPAASTAGTRARIEVHRVTLWVAPSLVDSTSKAAVTRKTPGRPPHNRPASTRADAPVAPGSDRSCEPPVTLSVSLPRPTAGIMQGSGRDVSSAPGEHAAAQTAERWNALTRHVTEGSGHQDVSPPRFDGDGTVDRPTPQGEQGPAPSSKAVTGRPPKVIWRFAPDDRSRLQRLLRFLFEPDTEQEQVEGSADRHARNERCCRTAQPGVRPPSLRW